MKRSDSSSEDELVYRGSPYLLCPYRRTSRGSGFKGHVCARKRDKENNLEKMNPVFSGFYYVRSVAVEEAAELSPSDVAASTR